MPLVKIDKLEGLTCAELSVVLKFRASVRPSFHCNPIYFFRVKFWINQRAEIWQKAYLEEISDL